MGWDNYSSYFNLKTNIFRTFFATWREYRGLGVPSDSEVTDVFRQIFYFLIHFIIPENLLDQVYYLLSLWLGILSMYFFINKFLIVFPLNKEELNEKKRDLVAFVGAFFYLFNLNTLSVFYSPLIPFTNRFYSLPLTLWFFINLIKNQNLKNFLIIAFILIFTSGSYITATVLITSSIAFIIFLFFATGFKKTFLYFLIFILINSFWVLPFINYTINKSSIIPLARTFIEINESMLNKPEQNFSLKKQLILTPSFFEMSFSSLDGKKFPIHPKLEDFEKNKNLLLSFSIFYILGASYLVITFKKNKKYLWLSFWIFIFLFLSLKEHSPLGFIYSFIKKQIPIFDILFRISDTKFHSYISFAGSFTTGILIFQLLSLFNKKKYFYYFLISIYLIFIFKYSFLFKSYFDGNLINPFSYAKLPKEYFEIAEIINQSKERGRVLHLPFDWWHNYWRSYQWGYLGSAFLNFLIDKPYIDKTFEPASMENTYLHSKINKILERFYRSKLEKDKEKEAMRFFQLLKQAGIKWVIDDRSLSTSIYTRNVLYSAKQFIVRIAEMINYLEKIGLVKKDKEYSISLNNYYPFYEKLYPYNIIGQPHQKPLETKIILYELSDIDPPFYFLSDIINIDPNLDNVLETELDNFASRYFVQDKNKQAIFFPFLQQNHQLVKDKLSFKFKIPSNIKKGEYYILSTTNNISPYMIDVYGVMKNQKLILDFYYHYYPDVNNKNFSRFIGQLEFDILNDNFALGENAFFVSDSLIEKYSDIIDDYRLQIDKIFIPLPRDILSNRTYIISFMVNNNDFEVSLLNKFQVKNLIKKENQLVIDFSSEKQQKEKFYYPEIELIVKGKDYANLCLRQLENNLCFNSHRVIRLFENGEKYRIATNNQISNLLDYVFDINKGEINQIFIHLYEKLGEAKKLNFDPTLFKESLILKDDLIISFPKAQSFFSYYHHPTYEFFHYPEDLCRSGEKRKLKFFNNFFINEMKDCEVYFAQNFNYSFTSPYLFSFEYWIASGQQPIIVLGKEKDNYLLERVSLYQGYPQLTFEMKKKSEIKENNLFYSSRFIDPLNPSDLLFKEIYMHLAQDAPNKGVMAVGNFEITQLPYSWYSLAIVPKELDFDKIVNSEEEHKPINYQKILPSLWKVKLSAENGYLVFNEGYDKQWGIYGSFISALFGKSRFNNHRCNGFANCFEIKNINEKNRTYYVFYTPERLYFLGWILTLLTIGITAFFLLKKPTNSLNP